MNRIARFSVLSKREGDCPACRGSGCYRMGCARGVCHVCRGRGFIRVVFDVPSTPRNQRKGGGEHVQKAIALLGLLAVLACSGVGIDSSDSGIISGLVPRRGPVDVDALSVSGLDGSALVDVGVGPDAAPPVTPDATPAPIDAGRNVAPAKWGRCPDLPAGSYTRTLCSAPGQTSCYVATFDGGQLQPCWRALDGAEPMAYVTSCAECPR